MRHPQLRRLDSTHAAVTAALEMVQVTGGCEGVAVTRMLDEVFESPSLVLRHSSTQAVAISGARIERLCLDD